MTPETPNRYRIFGGPGSPYSHKMRAVIRDLVKLAGRSLLPMMLAVSQAVAKSEQMTSYEVDGMRLTGIARPEAAKCWLWLKRLFADLTEPDRESLRGLLQDAGFWEALAFAPGEAERVPAFAMS